MESLQLADFAWVLLFVAITGILSVRLKLPPVAGLLIAGMIIGPNLLQLVDLPTINAFADIGATLLLFMIGVEFSVAKLFSTGLRTILGSFLLVLMCFLIMHEIAILLGFGSITAIFIASIFSMSSTAIMMKILEQKQLLGRQEVPIMVAMLIIEDIVAVFMLTFFSNFRGGNYASEGIIGSVLVSLGVLAFTYVILLNLLKKFSDTFLRYQADDTMILFSLTLGIGMSILASFLGLTPSIGAFLAGSIIAGLPNGRDFEDAIRPFSLIFSSFFFLSIGMLIDPSSLLASTGSTLILIASFMVVIFFATTFVFYLICSSGRASIFAGLAMIPLGEFSLLIAKESVGIAETNLVGIASVGVLITSIACSLSLKRSENLYTFFKKSLPHGFLETLGDASTYFQNVVSAFEPGGHIHRIFVIEARNRIIELSYLFIIAILLWFVRPYSNFELYFFGYSIHAYSLAIIIAVLISIIPVSRVLLSIKKIFDILSIIFSRTTPQASKGAILRNIAVSGIFFIFATNSYFFVDTLALPRIFNWLAPVFALLSLFFFWSAVRAASFGFFLGELQPLTIFRESIGTHPDDVIVVGRPSAAKKYESKGGKRKRRFMFLR